MLISLILAWLAVVLCIMTALKYIARISGSKKLNNFFRKVHIPFGWLLIIVSIAHGIVAGNTSSATLSDFIPFATLFTLNWGTACLLIGIFLALTYLFRKQLKKSWMPLHRFLTVAMLLCLFIHIYDTGIALPNVIFGNDTTETSQPVAEDYNVLEDESSTNEEESSDTASSSNTSSPENSDTTNNVTFSGATLKDGTYEGSASAYNGEITVSVKVANGVVTSIKVTNQNETPRFYEEGVSVLDSITNEQSLNVDTVSGATFTSAGLINACYDALTPAIIDGKLNVNQVDLSQISRHGH